MNRQTNRRHFLRNTALAGVGLCVGDPSRAAQSRSPSEKLNIGIIGVGEGSTFTVPNYLHGYLGIDPTQFHLAVNPTYKLGIRFIWGTRPFFHYTFTNQLNARYSQLPKANGYYCDENFEYADLNSALMAHNKVFERQADGGPLVNSDVAYHVENKQFVAFLERVGRALGRVG